jgi:parallel beta-helix repeat protein
VLRSVRRVSIAGSVVALALLGVQSSLPSQAQAAGRGQAVTAGSAKDQAADKAAASGPTAPPIGVCGNSGLLDGPATAPAGAVTVAAGDDSGVDFTQPDTTYWFAPGTHYLGSGEYTQIEPGDGATFTGGPGAVISGTDSSVSGYVQNNYAFTQTATDVTIEYLTIENFSPPGGEGAVDHDSGDGWTIGHDTITGNAPGAGMMIGSDTTVEDNCLTENGEYGFNAYLNPSDPSASSVTQGPKNITVSDNEISYNDTCNWEQDPGFPITSPAGCSGAGQFDGCGCSGGGKFWQAQNVTVSDNYVHGNYDTGLWMDTDNDGFDVQGNYISSNFAEGIIYEISYNALIQDNTFLDNAWGEGPELGGFPDSAVYISESGGDSRAPNSFGYATLDVENNTFTDNWGGVVLWENSNRYCGDGSDGACTLVDPAVATLTSCPAALSNSSENQPGDSPDYYDLCRWKTQNVTVSGNVFNLNPGDIGSDCTVDNYCGFNALFSEYGSTEPWTAWVVPENISDHQNNVFAGNTYNGPWNFVGFNQGDVVTWSQWTAGFEDDNGSGDTFNPQDAGSTYNPAVPAQAARSGSAR